MGRHSAPDESDDEVAPAGIALVPDDELARVIEARGRHARPDEAAPDIDVERTQRIAAVPDAPSDSELTLNLAKITAPVEDTPIQDAPKPDRKAVKAAKAQRKAATKAERKARESNTKADLRLLRQHPAVRAQAIAAVLVSFLGYTLVIIVLGRAASYLLWLWIPIVMSGILVGLVLDVAHRRLTNRTDQPSR